MALNFPASPVDGQIYYDTTSGNRYTYVAASTKWVYTANNTPTGSVYLSNTAPPGAVAGDLWWNNDLGTMFIFYSDGDSTQWVETSPSGGFSDIAATFTIANAAFGVANAAFDSANNVAPQVAPSYNTANGAYIVANSAYTFANGVNSFAYGVAINAAAAFAAANNVAPQVTPAFNTANAAYTVANSAYTFANGVATNAAAAFAQSNTDNVRLSAAYVSLNAGYTVANAAFDKANAANVLAYNTGIGANNYAGAMSNSVNAYTSATYVKLTAAQQTITGDLAVTGNLTFLGNSTIVSSNNLVVGDSLIYLAANNYSGTDLLDIGFIANYGNTTLANVHTGLVRDATNKQYYLFQGYDAEPANNTFVPGGNNMTNAVLVADFNTSNLTLGGANAIVWIKTAFDTVNAAYTSSNSDYVVSNAAFGFANGVATNTSAAFGFANGISTNTTAAFAKANAALANTSGVYFNGDLYFPSGNVGIGTTSTTNKLEVVGKTRLNFGNIGANFLSLYNGATNESIIRAAASSVTYNGMFLCNNANNTNQQSNTSYTSWFVDIGGTAADGTTFKVATQDTFRVGRIAAGGNFYNTDALFTINNTGNVGIGTISPTGRLDVWGALTGRSIQANPNDAGYVLSSFNASASNAEQFNIKHNLGAVDIRSERGQLNVIANTAAAIVFYTANTAERMRVHSTGYVGIGTSSPQGILHTDGGGDQTIYFTHSDNVAGRTVTLRMGSDNSTYLNRSTYIQAIEGSGVDNYALAFGTTQGTDTSAQERMRITREGNVGIGTTSPSGTLTIDGAGPTVEIRSGGWLMMRPSANTWDYRLRTTGTGSAAIFGVYTGNNLVTPMTTFTAGGNVGIGNTAPVLKLEVAGNMSVDAFVENSANITTSYTITTGRNAMTAGPVTLNTGVTITVPSGSTWTVV